MSKLSYVLYVLILAAWFGVIVMIAIAIPTLFKTLPSRELAGDAAATIFQSFDKTQMILLPLLWITGIGSLAFRQPTRRRLTVVMAGLCVLTVSVGAMLGSVAPRMHTLHAQMKAAPTAEAAEPTRAEFQRLHTIAENLAKLNLFLTLGLLIECVWTQDPRKKTPATEFPTTPTPAG